MKAVVRRVWDETPRLKGVEMEVSKEIARKYERPGQVVVLRPNGTDQVYMALASSPGDETLELLVGPAAVEKLQPKVGLEIALDPPMGKGFPLEMAEGKDVLLFAVGSALAPIRPVIEALRKNRGDYGRVVLYVGASTEADFPYQKEYDAWKRDRIDIVRAISKPWVQDLFAKDPGDLEDAVAFVCGMKEMVEGVTNVLVKAGVPAERIGKNW